MKYILPLSLISEITQLGNSIGKIVSPQSIDDSTIEVDIPDEWLEYSSFILKYALKPSSSYNEKRYCSTIIDDLLLQLKNQSVTTTQMDTLLTKLQGVLIFLLSGHIRVARFRANALTTDTLYTSARKTWLLNRMDLEIVKL